jgi:hypothetical protein
LPPWTSSPPFCFISSLTLRLVGLGGGLSDCLVHGLVSRFSLDELVDALHCESDEGWVYRHDGGLATKSVLSSVAESIFLEILERSS